MSESLIPKKTQFPINIEAGRSYWWCSCGKSASQPFCDGSHEGSEFLPMEYKATETDIAYFCGCRNSLSKPLCDGMTCVSMSINQDALDPS